MYILLLLDTSGFFFYCIPLLCALQTVAVKNAFRRAAELSSSMTLHALHKRGFVNDNFAEIQSIFSKLTPCSPDSVLLKAGWLIWRKRTLQSHTSRRNLQNSHWKITNLHLEKTKSFLVGQKGGRQLCMHSHKTSNRAYVHPCSCSQRILMHRECA